MYANLASFEIIMIIIQNYFQLQSFIVEWLGEVHHAAAAVCRGWEKNAFEILKFIEKRDLISMHVYISYVHVSFHQQQQQQLHNTTTRKILQRRWSATDISLSLSLFSLFHT